MKDETEVSNSGGGSQLAIRETQMEAQQRFRQAQHVAGMCREMAERTAVQISGNRYIPVATWEAIATTHGCVVGTRDVEWIPPQEGMNGGFRCIGELRNIATGALIAQAEGFVGTDEVVWYGGEKDVWDRKTQRLVKKQYARREDAAIRAMCQTRAAGRVCKQAFAHVVVLMNAGLSTTPLEEINPDEEPLEASGPQPQQPTGVGAPIHDWRDIHIHMPWSKKHGPGCTPDHPKGMQLGELSTGALRYYQENFVPRPQWNDVDRRLRRALDMSMGRIPPDPRDVESEVIQ